MPKRNELPVRDANSARLLESGRLQMKSPWLTPPRLTRLRIVLALVVAAVADGLQIPFQLAQPLPEIIDVVAMGLTFFLLGFHVLLLPTFVLELLPLVNAVPTWTGCVIAVIALRARSQRVRSQTVIEVEPPAGEALPPRISAPSSPPPPRAEPPKLPPAGGA